MKHIRSRDGTDIAFEQFGQGQPLILVVGAFNDRSTGTPLARSLADACTVYTYDRRGRGDSTDAPRYAIEREIEDLDALIAEAGGSAAVFGYSSGALLALHAAATGSSITRLAVYDAPYGMSAAVDHAAELDRLVRAGRRGDAVEYFQSRIVGIPDDVVLQLRAAPFRPALEAIAHTLVYDATILQTPLVGTIATPARVIAGGTNPFMRTAAESLAAALPNGHPRILEDQTHDIDPSVLAPVLKEFLS
jgi:pimeloyl-ACP methyl ester carboxylesterase